VVRLAHRRARRRPSSERLHRLRIQVRRLRHLSEVRTRLDRRHPHAFPPAVRRLQTRLGRLHDLDVVLAGLDEDLRSTEWARSLKRERRRVRTAIRTSLEARPWPRVDRAQPAKRPRRRSRRASS
jgi:CHAD domain-containing protein